MIAEVALPVTGGCHCGAVRYAIAAQPIAARTCWCGFCQKIGGGSATVNLFFPADAVTITGALSTYVRTADSGAELHSQFCPTCATDIATQAPIRAHIIGIRAGTLDDPAIAAPQSTIWTAAAPPWAAIDPALPAYPGQVPVAPPPA